MWKNTPTNGETIEDIETLRMECAGRFREWIRSWIPSGSRKRLANILSVSPETVDSWLDSAAPRLPSTKHLLAALRVFGPDFAAYVLSPCGSWIQSLSFEARLQRVRQEIEELKSEACKLDKMGEQMEMVRNIEVALMASKNAIEKASGM